MVSARIFSIGSGSLAGRAILGLTSVSVSVAPATASAGVAAAILGPAPILLPATIR